jgi:hypothetical protein
MDKQDKQVILGPQGRKALREQRELRELLASLVELEPQAQRVVLEVLGQPALTELLAQLVQVEVTVLRALRDKQV